MIPKIYLNGEFLAPEQAHISVMDRGFLFGDGIYEVIPAYAGRLFRLPQHLHRLTDSLHAIRMENPLSEQAWTQMLERLVEQLPGCDQTVYLQVTRGAADIRDHAIPKGIDPTLFAMTSPMLPPDPVLAQSGIAAITLDDTRWHQCNIKAITLLANVLLRQQANDRGANESILIRDGNALEGAASNLFIVEDGLLITPPKSRFLLPGITRDLILEMADAHRIPFKEEDIRADRLRSADEIWLTSSTKEIMPVTRLDELPVGEGKPGPSFNRVTELFSAYKERVRLS